MCRRLTLPGRFYEHETQNEHFNKLVANYYYIHTHTHKLDSSLIAAKSKRRRRPCANRDFGLEL